MLDTGRKGGCGATAFSILCVSFLIFNTTLSLTDMVSASSSWVQTASDDVVEGDPRSVNGYRLIHDGLDGEVSLIAERRTALFGNDDKLTALPCPIPYGDLATTMLEYKGHLYIGSANSYNHAWIYRYDPITDVCMRWMDTGIYYVYSSAEYGGVAFWGGRETKRATTGPLFYFDGTVFGVIPGKVWFSSSRVSGWIEDFEIFNNRLYASGTICKPTLENKNNFFVKYCHRPPCLSSTDWHWTRTSPSDIGKIDDGTSLEEFNGDLYLATYDPASVLRYHTSSNTWHLSLSGAVDGNTPGWKGGYGIFGLANHSGYLHALTYRYGWHWTTQDGVSWTGVNIPYEILTRAFVFEDRIYLGATDNTGNYIISYDGSSWSKFVLGDTHFRYFAQCGSSMCTTCGIQVFRTLTTPASIEAAIDCDPDTLNLGSEGKWITCYVSLPFGYDPTEIDPFTILLNGMLSPELNPIYGFVTDEESYITNRNGDGIEERMVKFNRSDVQDMLKAGDIVELVITGTLVDTTPFEGAYTGRVIGQSEPHHLLLSHLIDFALHFRDGRFS